MIFQIQLFRTQDIKYRRCVRRCDHRSNQKALQPRQAQRQMYEHAYKSGGQRHAQCGQKQCLCRHTLCFLHICPKTSVKDDKDQADRTDRLRHSIIIKYDPEDPIFPKQHSQSDKNQQGWHSQPGGHASHQDTDHDHNANKQDNLIQRSTPFVSQIRHAGSGFVLLLLLRTTKPVQFSLKNQTGSRQNQLCTMLNFRSDSELS